MRRYTQATLFGLPAVTQHLVSDTDCLLNHDAGHLVSDTDCPGVIRCLTPDDHRVRPDLLAGFRDRKMLVTR